MSLTELQAKTLERRMTGDKWASRINFKFCFSEREKYVQVWESDRTTVVSEATINALILKGYYYGGDVTEAGRAALAKYRTKNPVPAEQPS
jgi:hypothetical protein